MYCKLLYTGNGKNRNILNYFDIYDLIFPLTETYFLNYNKLTSKQ